MGGVSVGRGDVDVGALGGGQTERADAGGEGCASVGGAVGVGESGGAGGCVSFVEGDGVEEGEDSREWGLVGGTPPQPSPLRGGG